MEMVTLSPFMKMNSALIVWPRVFVHSCSLAWVVPQQRQRRVSKNNEEG
jgi:hypothetical protein